MRIGEVGVIEGTKHEEEEYYEKLEKTIIYLNSREQLNRLAREMKSKRKEMESIKIKNHGHIAGYILGDRIFVRMTLSCHSRTVESDQIIIDTGSNISVISPSLWKSLSSASPEMDIFGAHTRIRARSERFTVTIGNIAIEDHHIAIADLDVFHNTGIDGLIGMDIIQAGELHTYQTNGLPCFEFNL